MAVKNVMDGYEQEDQDVIDTSNHVNASTLSAEEIYDILLDGGEDER